MQTQYLPQYITQYWGNILACITTHDNSNHYVLSCTGLVHLESDFSWITWLVWVYTRYIQGIGWPEDYFGLSEQTWDKHGITETEIFVHGISLLVLVAWMDICGITQRVLSWLKGSKYPVYTGHIPKQQLISDFHFVLLACCFALRMIDLKHNSFNTTNSWQTFHS